MDDPRWLRLITIGLVLAAIAVGYFLISGKFVANKVQRVPTQVSQIQQIPSSSSNPQVLGQDSSPVPVATTQASPQSAYAQIVNRTQGQVQTLPKTGFPVGLMGIFSAAAMVVGFSLRKFPK